MDSRQTGLVIASRRKQLHMTQQELADALGVTNKAVSKWETGQGLPDIGLLEALSDTLGVSIDALIRGELPGRPACSRKPAVWRAPFCCLCCGFSCWPGRRVFSPSISAALRQGWPGIFQWPCSSSCLSRFSPSDTG